MADGDRRIEVPAQKGRIALGLVASVVSTVVAAVLAVQSVQHGVSSLWNALIASLFALLCGLISVSAVGTLVSTRPALRIDNVGIDDTSSLLGPGLIRWGETAAISYYHFMVTGYILIEPRDVSAFARRKNVLQRATLWVANLITPAAINIPEAAIDISPRVLLREIRAQFASEIERYGIYVPEERHRDGRHKRARQ